jgi:hypothetical protein
MCAIGDSEGTVSIMQLGKPLYEIANKEKEIMVGIFDRETRREKNLEIARRLRDGDPKDKKKKKKDEPKPMDPVKLA